MSKRSWTSCANSNSVERTAVLLLAYGAPERVADVPAYLHHVTHGRPLPASVVAEVSRRYAQIGGGSPLRQWTERQAEALGRELGLPVYVGMRHWEPFVRDTLSRMRDDGVERMVALCLAPQYSQLSVEAYFRAMQEGMAELGYQPMVHYVRSYSEHPLLIEAFAERLARLLPAEMVLFTAHSLPIAMLDPSDPYPSEVLATARRVAERLQLPQWEFAYQSQGMSGGEWLGPTVEECIDRYALAGIRRLVIQPIGFVSDHVEILYDVDIQFRTYAAQRGIHLERAESLNCSPKFIQCLANLVRTTLAD